MKELHVIFIMERDPFKQGLPFYHFVRYMPEIGLALNDGVHIVCVNGEIQGEQTELAKVMHDMFCADPEEMLVEELARVARHFKQTPEGVLKMSSVVESIREEGRIKGRVEEKTEIALHMLRMGEFTPEKIALVTRMSVDEVRALAAAHAPDALEIADRAEAERAEKTVIILKLVNAADQAQARRSLDNFVEEVLRLNPPKPGKVPDDGDRLTAVLSVPGIIPGWPTKSDGTLLSAQSVFKSGKYGQEIQLLAHALYKAQIKFQARLKKARTAAPAAPARPI